MNVRLRFASILVLASIVAGGCSNSGPDEEVAYSRAGVMYGVADITITETNNWAGGYCKSVSITNKGSAPITNWTIVLRTNQSTIYDKWNATFTGTSGDVTIKPVNWNAAIAVGGKVDFGFCANKTGTNYEPVISTVTVVGGGPSGTGGSTSTGG